MNKPKQSKRKAFIFTTDALLALAAITIAATTFTIFATQAPNFDKHAELAQLGRDYLQLEINDPDWFYINTGLHVTSDENTFANNALVVNALLYKYPNICGCRQNTNPCVVQNNYCLKIQDIQTPDNVIRKAWVTP